MGKIILLESYLGPSTYLYSWKCTGRVIGFEELRSLGLWSDEHKRRHGRSSWIHEWFEIDVGDVIRLTVDDQDSDPEIEKDVLFLIEGLYPDPPKDIDTNKKDNAEDFLEKHFRRVVLGGD